jgi:hypothetical protein|tara:strand:+ start:2223 stop:3404 length:1182 start_codon:yes stop_codon:yes gene_type:complete
MSLTTHSRNTLEIANLSTQDDFFDNDDTGEGYTLSNATVQIVSLNDNLYLDGKTVVSDGNLSIGTSASNTYLVLGSASTPALKIDSSQRLDILSAKLRINGSDGTSGQVLTTDGLGNISWSTVDNTQYAIAGIQVNGSTTITAGSTSENIEIEAGSGIGVTTDPTATPKKITISNTNTAANAFSTFAVGSGSGSASGSDLLADSETDTLTFVAGSGITLTADANSDQITIDSTSSGSGSQDIFKNVSAPNQSTITASSTTDTLSLDTVEPSVTRTERKGKLDIVTDTSQRSITLKANIPITHSHSGKMPLVLSGGSTSGVPLKNHFIPVTTTASVNGGGSTVAMSTRAVEVLQTDGSTLSRIVMPPTSDGKSLVLTTTSSDGTTQTQDINMGE